MKRTKKALSLLLTLAMVVAMMPAISLVFPEKAKAYSTSSSSRLSPMHTLASSSLTISRSVISLCFGFGIDCFCLWKKESANLRFFSELKKKTAPFLRF